MGLTDIAVVGMTIRCPGAADLDEFWANLVGGVESISRFALEELEHSEFLPVDPAHLDFVPAAGVLDGADRFDNRFFGISPAEASAMDPQHRLFLEAAWTAMEDAGHDLTTYDGNVSVYAGCASNTHLLSMLPHAGSRLRSYQGLVGNEKDYLATRVSYKLNLSGESITVQTACSTSLVAVHLACQSLLSGQSDAAIAGGVSAQARQRTGYVYQEDAIFSPDGHCRAFSADAQGTVFSNGLGVVVLRRLDDAIRDGDRIYGVIKGTAVNNDANAKVSYTAPSVDAQAAVVAAALEFADCRADTIGYIEAHGTGTPIGDPIEVEALTHAFRRTSDGVQTCALGSVKTNIGHLNVAAGVVGLIKSALILYHGAIPPSLGFAAPNPEIDFANSPFFVNTALRPWPRTDAPRRVGVSSFGIGGTNAHAVLEEAPPRPDPSDDQRPVHVIALSAKDPAGLARLAERHRRQLAPVPSTALADYAYTVNVGRSRLQHSAAVWGRTVEEIRSHLGLLATGDGSGPGRAVPAAAAARVPRVAFLFTGQGAQHPGMAADLYDSQPVFRSAIDECAALVREVLDHPLLEYLRVDGDGVADLGRTDVAQPVLFAVEWALAQMWASWGVRPAAVLGHSLGEVTAACTAGVLSLDQAVRLVTERGRLMETLPEGSMAAVFADPGSVRSALSSVGGPVDIAAVNGPRHTVISGAPDAVERAVAQLEDEGALVQRLKGAHGFHSPLVEPIQGSLGAVAAGIDPAEARCALVLAASGDTVEVGDTVLPGYWAEQVRRPVGFARSVDVLLDLGIDAVVEIGPDAVLTKLVRRTAPEELLTLPSLERGQADWDVLAAAVGGLHAAGVAIDWSGFDAPYGRRRVGAASYPFAEIRHSLAEEVAPSTVTTGSTGSTPPPPPSPVRVEPVAVDPAWSRLERITAHLCGLAAQLLAVAPEEVGVDEPWPLLGLDSLVMIEVLHIVRETYEVPLKVRRLLDDLTTIALVAAHIDQELPAGLDPWAKLVEGPAAEGPGREPAFPDGSRAPERPIGAPGGVEALMAAQLELLSSVVDRQLEVLDSIASAGANQAAASATEAMPSTVARRPSEPGAGDRPIEPFVPHQPITVVTGPADGIDQAALDAFVDRYVDRTAGSKRLAADHRAVLADNDNRVISNFRMSTKELIYPIAADRSEGSRLWDVDGNEYIDVVMGFGSNLFGHRDPVIRSAIDAQLDRGMHIGAQSDLAGLVAQQVCNLTGMQRVAFTNSGSEAVMTALRLARAATGRTKIAMFAGSYHGHFDGTLARREVLGARGTEGRPLAPGTPDGMVGDVLVLDYGDPSSLEVIEAHRADLAAVIVEPVQSRRPDVQPAAFLRDLRTIASEHGITLVFDEIISGFRMAPGGAQEWFGVSADLATYGKVLGGGLPIGAVAGKAGILDWIDGGSWSYGDRTAPASETTFFAGTFCKHPLAMAAAQAVLGELQRRGPGLQSDLNARTEALVTALTQRFDDLSVAIDVRSFGSLFRLASQLDIHLLFPALVARGVHIREGHNAFLSVAHADEDVTAIVEAVTEAVEDVRSIGYLSGGASRPARSRSTALDDIVPLTHAQRQLWMMAAIDPETSAAYNQASAIRLEGPLDLDALRKSVTALGARHETLRMRIDPAGEHGVIGTDELQLEVVVPEEVVGASDPWLAARRWLERRALVPFDLGTAPLIKVLLVEISPTEHLMGLVAHHVIADGWSMGVLWQEIAAGYRDGPDADLPEPVPFSAFARWLDERAGSAGAAASLRFWSDRLLPMAAPPDLPLDRPRPTVASPRGARQVLHLDEALVRSLRELAAASSSTLVMVLLAGYEVILHRLTGDDDLRIGIPTSGRGFPGSSRVVGHCTNLITHRSTATGSTPFADVLTRTKDGLLAELEHQDVPFGTVVDHLGVRLDPARTPLFDVVFNADSRVMAPTLEGLAVDPVILDRTTATFDLVLNVVDAGEQLVLELDYRTDLFDAGTVARFGEMLERILRAASTTPGTAIGELALEGDEERRRIEEWGSGPEVYVPTLSVHELFRRRSMTSPDDICVHDGARTLTYAELDRWSGEVAAVLSEGGIGVGDIVAVAVARSCELYASVLGVLRTGAAYAPCADAAIGTEGSVLAACRAVISVGPWTGRAAPGALVLDVSDLHPSGPPPPNYPSGPDDAAWVIFTSGSTGSPNGVVGTHGALVNRLSWMWDRWPYEPGERSCLRSSTAFVDALWELFGPLLAGTPTVVLPPEAATDPSVLVASLAAEQISRIVLVPSLLAVVLDEVNRSGVALDALRVCTSSGEAISRELVRRFHELLPHATLLNLYGSTEVMGDVTWLECRADLPGEDPVPLGAPIPNVQVQVLDTRKRPVPIGVAGDLHVSGAALALGYLDKPGLTAERFGPAPGVVDRRSYATGDRARWRPDGRLEYLGRSDRQVKIRGTRVEPAEVEAVVRSHPAVASAAVVAVPLPSAEMALVAYVTSSDAGTTDGGAIRSWVNDQLPSRLRAAAVVVTDQMPITATGKVDRRALEGRGFPALHRRFEPPVTVVEQLVHEIWSDVLEVEVNMADAFLDLGGSSLTAMRLLVRLRTALDIEMTATDLFESSSVRSFARVVEDRLIDGAADEADALLDRFEADEVER